MKQGKLKMYEESFESRVQAVDDKYRNRISNLNVQIDDLRLVYLVVTGLLFIRPRTV